MLEDAEFERVYSAYIEAIRMMKQFRARTSAGIAEAAAKYHPSVRALYRRFLKRGGFQELVLPLDHLIEKHRLSAYGPACANCGRPLRTPEAKVCVACGAKRAA